MQSSESLRPHVEGQKEAMLQLIEELVVINSHTLNRAGGLEVGQVLAREAKASGLLVRTEPSEAFADHLIIETEAGARSSQGCIALVGHLDTVFPPGTFQGYSLEHGIAKGPGVLDMKGGLTVALFALRAYAKVKPLAELPLRFVIVSEEEIGSPEGKGLLQRELAGAACALVFEAGRAEDKIITARKGSGSAKATARGKAAHAANGHKEGANAIWALSKFIDSVQGITDYTRGITVNVGTIKGGEAKNTVPAFAECDLDFRFETIADADSTFALMKEMARAAALSVPGTTMDLEGGPGRYPLERTEANAELFRQYAECAKAAGLGFAEAALIAGASDASSTSAIGIPSIDGLGPRGTGFHTHQEVIEVASLEPKTLALASFFVERSLLQQKVQTP